MLPENTYSEILPRIKLGRSCGRGPLNVAELDLAAVYKVVVSARVAFTNYSPVLSVPGKRWFVGAGTGNREDGLYLNTCNCLM